MESFLNRYRNITVLLLVIFAQLILLAIQVKNDQEVRIIRVWTVTAVTPVARIVEGLRGGSAAFIRNYITLHKADEDNRRLQSEVDRLKLENISLKNELNKADRAQALLVFQSHTPSKTLAASTIASGAGSNAQVRFVDRGSVEGVMRGMAVVTPDGIVGKVIAAYPTASEVLLVTDQDFAAGVISSKGVRGTLKGQGKPLCIVDYVPFEEKVEVGDEFRTSGDDRIFPRGFPVGVVKAVRPGQPYKEIYLEPTGLQRGLDDVLILIQGVNQDIPETPAAGLASTQPVYIAPSPQDPNIKPAEAQPPGTPAVTGTEADKLRAVYKSAGEAQNHNFGEGGVGAKPPDFTKLPVGPGAIPVAAPPTKTAPTQPQGGLPPAAKSTAPQPAVSAPLTKGTASPQPSGALSKSTKSTAPGQPAGVVPPATKGTGPQQTPTGLPAATKSTAPKPQTATPATKGTAPILYPDALSPATKSTAPQPAAKSTKSTKSTAPVQPPDAKPGDTTRRANQAAGTPPGGRIN